MDKKQEEELFDTLHFIKDRMVTKDELKDGLHGLRTELKADISRLENDIGRLENDIGRLENKVDNLTDSEINKRKQLEVRVSKVETKVFAK